MRQGMERVAFEMVSEEDGRPQLLETIEAERVSRVMQDAFETETVNITAVLLNSVLLTRGARRGRSLSVGFALRVLQEFLLASYLVRNGLDYSTFPTGGCCHVSSRYPAAENGRPICPVSGFIVTPKACLSNVFGSRRQLLERAQPLQNRSEDTRA